MKINLLLPAILLLFPGTLKYGPEECKIYAEGKSSNAIIETIPKTEYSSAGKDPLESNHYYELTIDHLFVYNNPMVNYKIAVSGTIPVHFDENFCVYVKFPLLGYEIIQMVSSLSGSGRVQVSGRGSMDAGSFKVNKINYDSEMNIDIKGKTRFLETEKGPIPLLNFALQESWNTDLSWDIETSDPENDDLRYDMLTKIVPTKTPDSPHTGRTIECIEGYIYEDQTYEHVSSIPGMGTFRWRYTISHHFVKTDKNEIEEKPVDPKDPDGSRAKYVKVEDKPKLTVNSKNNQQNYTDDRPKPKDYVTTYAPRLGPPIESIFWELIDCDTAPLKR